MEIFHYLDPNLVMFLDTSSRDETLHEIVHKIFLAGKLEEEEDFYQAILSREEIVSTGIGMGVAIPHAKLPSFDRFFVALAVLQKPIDWQAIDGTPVRLVFMIGGPDDRQTEYLQILSALTKAIKNEERRKKLLTLQDSQAMIELFHNI